MFIIFVWRRHENLVSVHIHIIDISATYSKCTRFGVAGHLVTKRLHIICDPIPKGAFNTSWAGKKCLNDLYQQTNVFLFPLGTFINIPHLSLIELLNSRFPSRIPGDFEAAIGVWSNCCWHAHPCPAAHLASGTYGLLTLKTMRRADWYHAVSNIYSALYVDFSMMVWQTIQRARACPG